MSSPVSSMDFYQALKQIMSDQRVTRLEWNNASFYCTLRQGTLQLHKPDGQYYNWIINDGDILAEDWVIARAH